MRDDVLRDELRARLGASEETLRGWFESLRPAERQQLLGIVDQQIASLETEPGQGVIRQDSLELIKKLFSAWMSPEPR
jgi:hypothetical protein